MPGTITLKPIEANLKDQANLHHRSDPHYTLVLGNQHITAQSSKQDELHPHWKQGSSLSMKTSMHSSCTVELKEEDDLLSDDCIGFIEVNVKEIEQKGTLKKWLPISRDGNNAGEVLFELTYHNDHHGGKKGKKGQEKGQDPLTHPASTMDSLDHAQNDLFVGSHELRDEDKALYDSDEDVGYAKDVTTPNLNLKGLEGFKFGRKWKQEEEQFDDDDYESEEDYYEDTTKKYGNVPGSEEDPVGSIKDNQPPLLDNNAQMMLDENEQTSKTLIGGSDDPNWMNYSSFGRAFEGRIAPTIGWPSHQKMTGERRHAPEGPALDDDEEELEDYYEDGGEEDDLEDEESPLGIKRKEAPTYSEVFGKGWDV